MNEIGLLWQSDTITPAQEHFITFLIKQKLLVNTEKLQILNPTNIDKVFVLFLPSNEIHELGLMYLNYEILFHGYKTIYLGESVPLSSLVTIKNNYDSIVFISYMTVQPNKDEINNYIKKINSDLLNDKNTEVWLLGRMVEYIDNKNIKSKMSIYKSISELVENL
jgi:methanogenic corrinoid protein MtbC1